MRQIPKPGERYRHFKNKLYQVITVAKHTETGEDMVVYQALYDDFAVYVRPLALFLGEVEHEKYPEAVQQYRFEKVESKTWKVQAEQTEEPGDPAGVEAESEEIENVGVDPRLLAILDADTYNEKYKLLSSIKGDMTDRLINDLAVALDITVDDGPVDFRYEKLKSALAMLCKYEVNRLR